MRGEIGEVAVIGAGAWGTTMAIHLAEVGLDVVMWARDPERAARMSPARSAADRGIRFTVGIWDHIYRGGVQGGGIAGASDCEVAVEVAEIAIPCAARIDHQNVPPLQGAARRWRTPISRRCCRGVSPNGRPGSQFKNPETAAA